MRPFSPTDSRSRSAGKRVALSKRAPVVLVDETHSVLDDRVERAAAMRRERDVRLSFSFAGCRGRVDIGVWHSHVGHLVHVRAVDERCGGATSICVGLHDVPCSLDLLVGRLLLHLLVALWECTPRLFANVDSSCLDVPQIHTVPVRSALA